jgi:hypothetical protein
MIASSALADPWWCFKCCQRDTFGEAFRSARDSQILYPGNCSNVEPVEGMDGQAAETAYGKYLDSFNQSSCGNGSGTVGFVPLVSSPSK